MQFQILLILFIVVLLYVLSVYNKPEGFNANKCTSDKECPVRFKCKDGKCIDTRPKML